MKQPEETSEIPLNPEERAAITILSQMKDHYQENLPESFKTPLVKACKKEMWKVLKNAEDLPIKGKPVVPKPSPKIGRKRSEDEKALLKKFRQWIGLPTHPDVLRWLAEAMVEHELKARFHSPRFKQSKQ